jgi:hypothetical protein
MTMSIEGIRGTFFTTRLEKNIPERLATEPIDISKSPGTIHTVSPVAIIINIDICAMIFNRFLGSRNVPVVNEKIIINSISVMIVPYFWTKIFDFSFTILPPNFSFRSRLAKE